MIVHLISGDAAADRLREALLLEPALAGEVIALPDRLHHGPLHREAGESFHKVRAAYWRAVLGMAGDAIPPQSLQEEKLLQASNILQKTPQARIWFWMAPAAADVVAYSHSLRYLGKHTGRVFLINIAGLPFLDENGKVFFPQSFDQVPAREFVKARRLARPLSPAEAEIDAEAWAQIAAKESFYRFLKEGKKIATEEAAYFDRDLLQGLRSGPVKAGRLASQLVLKQKLQTDEAALLFRIQMLGAAGQLTLQGDLLKNLRDREIALPETVETAAENQP